jgi:Helitron helicase-like domain at N-terminus
MHIHILDYHYLCYSAVVDMNGTNVSSDDITEHLLERMKVQMAEKMSTTYSEEHVDQDTIYMIPRGNKPANEYSNPHRLLGIFPTLFPYGYGALEDCSRPIKINFREHLRYLLSFADRRFEEHHSFMFVVFNILQRRMSCFHAHLMTSRPYFQHSAQLLESLSSEDVATALMNISKAPYSKTTDEKINTLMKHIKVVGGHVMGSAHSRTTLRTKIHSLCFNIGLPSLFVTINPADIHSPVALYFAGVNLDLDKVLPEALGTSYERAQIIAKHPVATAKFFNYLIKNLLKTLVLGGVLGPVKAYFGTVEAQGRGSLHLHLLIWLNHEFSPAQLKEKIQNEIFRENLRNYLEDIVKEDLDLFQGNITHRCSSLCLEVFAFV